MPRNGAGSFSLVAGNPVLSGTNISSSVHNSTLSDIAEAITNSISKDGQTTPIGNLPMGGFRHTGISGGSSRNEYASLAQIQDNSAVWAGVAGGSENAVLLTVTPAIPAYVAGQSFTYRAKSTNTGNVVVSIGGLPDRNLQINGSSLVAGDHVADQWYRITYDGSGFQLEQISSKPLTSGIPTGALIYWPVSSLPDGFIKANGASLAISSYPALFSRYGYTFGGSGSSFRVPDLRGEFLRGWDDGRGVDFGRGLATIQGSQNASHNHGGATGVQSANHSHEGYTDVAGGHTHGRGESSTQNLIGGGSGAFVRLNNQQPSSTDYAGEHNHHFWTYGENANHTHSISSDGGGESRPRNFSAIVLIKY